MSKHKNRRKNKQLMRPIEKPEGYFYWEDLIERGWTDYECKRLRNYAPKKQPKLFIQEEVFAYEKIMKRERRRLEMEEKRKRKDLPL